MTKTKKKTYFVVTETNFEYNDEFHSVVEGGGGTPVAIFENEEVANKDARRRSVKAIKAYGADMIAGFVYGYGFDGTFKKVPSFLDGTVEDFDDILTVLDVENRTPKELEELESCLNFRFFAVTKV